MVRVKPILFNTEMVRAILEGTKTVTRQVARIFKTELVHMLGRVTRAGEEYVYLKGWAYMLRVPENETLIAEIEGDIKKEISVGCSVRERVCSICGGAMGRCAHKKGQKYGGKICHAVLRGAMDAYEWSFVTVPAADGGQHNG